MYEEEAAAITTLKLLQIRIQMRKQREEEGTPIGPDWCQCGCWKTKQGICRRRTHAGGI